jgi:hypothetical protein
MADQPDVAVTQVDLTEAARLQQYEVVWIAPEQYHLPGYPEGFGLEIQDFLGPGNLDAHGRRTVWVRGPVIEAAVTSGGVRLVRGGLVTLAIPHDQPRACRTGGRILPPASSERVAGHVLGSNGMRP